MYIYIYIHIYKATMEAVIHQPGFTDTLAKSVSEDIVLIEGLGGLIVKLIRLTIDKTNDNDKGRKRNVLRQETKSDNRRNYDGLDDHQVNRN